MLISIHGGLAAVAKTPELALDETEAKQLADALVIVSEQYPNVTPSPKMVAMCNLFAVSSAIYAPRLLLLRLNAQARAREKRAKTMDGVAEAL